jgi:general nucleoside transport system ATP-binding protein
MLIPPQLAPKSALQIEMLGMTKRFGAFTALENLSTKVTAGTVHALLGENGAGKSTLVKCLVGYYLPDAGEIIVDGKGRNIRSPHDAHALGIGMVYQHFTLVPSMTVAENLVMSRDDVPAIVNWRREREALAEFMKTVPFRIPLDVPVASLAAGEKQKTEILKQLYLQRRFVILDEPTSVLTPQEADDVLGMLRDMTRERLITVLMITHKFREVMAFCDEVTVLRRGKFSGRGTVEALTPAVMAEMMVGSRDAADKPVRGARNASGDIRLSIRGLSADNDGGLPAVNKVDLDVRSGEIVGIAGVSGNGQRELVEAVIGQRLRTAGEVRVNGEPYHATRHDIDRHHVFSLPEEPLRNACVPELSVAENIALRTYDRPPLASGPWLRPTALVARARELISEYHVKTRGPGSAIRTLSGGNVQRAVLARELSGNVSVLIAANPVFGLDFSAVADIHARIVAARQAGAAVLLVSEDIDELLELADRIVVMFDGHLVHETTIEKADIGSIGRAMAGHAEAMPEAA